MNQTFRVLLLTSITSGALSACGSGGSAVSGVTSGVVTGSYFRHAKVCLDTNSNGRCDPGKPSTYTDIDGAFSLPGKAAVVVEIGTDATRFDPDTKTETPITRQLVFRAPAEANQVVSGISTELQALMDDNGGDFASAKTLLAKRLGVAEDKLLGDHNKEIDPTTKAILKTEIDQSIDRISDATAEAGNDGDIKKSLRNRFSLDHVSNVVVIYAENRAFDSLYGKFPGANGIDNALSSNRYKQIDLDGSVLSVLPPTWGGMTSAGVTPVVAQADTANLPNAPFNLDGPKFNLSLNVKTRDLDHSFFFNQMQINGGKNDRFAVASDAGGLVMGNYDGSSLLMWKKARDYTIADNYFMGAFGGSFLNHFWLICACTPVYPNADTSPAKAKIANPGGTDGVSLLLDPSKGISSVLNSNGRPPYLGNGAITPMNGRFDKFYAVNTMQPAYQPSGNAPAAGGDPALADPNAASTLPPQDMTTVGDLLSKKSISWAWYAGAWTDAQKDRTNIYNNTIPNFQPHHQPFNFFRQFAPGTQARADHLKDGTDFLAAIQNGNLPQVTFYKPQGDVNEHPGYADVAKGDQHISDIIEKLKASPQWKNMVVVVTYDENGGLWDHVAPPKGDRFGPATRVPAIIISPYAKRGFVDHSQYDTTSILRFITHRFSLPPLDGLLSRDKALVANGVKPMGDLTGALDFTQK
ncbi:MAG: acid phosphatase [Polaromonas sp.]|uniref:acid phosphatase n=1 Tax=Polaromonas sp. TaxID=1869339 RepID=UPI0017AC26DA|nr:acid phosphatase [Polaromonas sp.]NMM09575.1 acid phosphatase [Polaromonas sp.]